MSRPTEPLGRRMGEDHGRLDSLFEAFRATPTSEVPARTVRFQEFARGLRVHIRLEEEVLFPAFLRRDPARRDVVSRMLDEHVEIEGALQALTARLAAGSLDTSDLEDTLVNTLWAHNAREEGLLYPDLDASVSDEERLESLSRLGGDTSNNVPDG